MNLDNKEKLFWFYVLGHLEIGRIKFLNSAIDEAFLKIFLLDVQEWCKYEAQLVICQKNVKNSKKLLIAGLDTIKKDATVEKEKSLLVLHSHRTTVFSALSDYNFSLAEKKLILSGYWPTSLLGCLRWFFLKNKKKSMISDIQKLEDLKKNYIKIVSASMLDTLEKEKKKTSALGSEMVKIKQKFLLDLLEKDLVWANFKEKTYALDKKYKFILSEIVFEDDVLVVGNFFENVIFKADEPDLPVHRKMIQGIHWLSLCPIFVDLLD